MKQQQPFTSAVNRRVNGNVIFKIRVAFKSRAFKIFMTKTRENIILVYHITGLRNKNQQAVIVRIIRRFCVTDNPKRTRHTLSHEAQK